MMKRLLLPALIAAALYLTFANRSNDLGSTAQRPTVVAEDALTRAYESHQSNIQVRGRGIVEKVLRDDNEGSRHQRFIVKLPSGKTLLIAHNIDLAPRVAPLNEGDEIEFNGEYEWNERGGVVHWTHIDPQGHHAPGWLKHDGRTFQ